MQKNLSVFMQHLFHRLGKEVRVVLDNGEKIRGVLKVVQFQGDSIRGIEVRKNDFTNFINYRHVIYIEAREDEMANKG